MLNIKIRKILSLLTVTAILLSSIVATGMVISADAIQYTDNCKIDFGSYNLVPTGDSGDTGNARNNAGDFTIVEDAAADGGKYLKFVRNTVTTGAAGNPAWYMFLINPTGSYTANGAVMLEPGAEYKISVKYKVTGFADDQIYQFRIFNTLGGYCGPGRRNDSTSTIVFADKGSKSDWTIGTGTITAPAGANNGYSLIGCLIPTASSTDSSMYLQASKLGWQYAIDYVKIERADGSGEGDNQGQGGNEGGSSGSGSDDTPSSTDNIKIDFDKYNIVPSSSSGGSVRTNAGTFTIGESAECADGKYLNFVDSSTSAGTHVAHYMFQLNPTGGNGSDTVTRLQEGTDYKIKVRYKVSNLDEAYKLHFRLYNSGSNLLTDWSNGGEKKVILDETITNTNGWAEKEYTFKDPGHAKKNWSLIATFAPHNKTGSVAAAATYEMAIDYFEITKVTAGDSNTGGDGGNQGSDGEGGSSGSGDDVVLTDNAEIDFSEYALKPTGASDASGNVRNNAGDFTIVDDAAATGGKYLNFVRNSVTTGAINNPAWYMFMLNSKGSYVRDGAVMLKPGAQYKITVKYKVSGFAEDQIYQFRIFNTSAGNFAPGQREDSSATVVFADRGNKTDWTIASGTITAPAGGKNGYSLIGCLIPTASMTATDMYVQGKTGWQAAIDYIKIEKVGDGDGSVPVTYPIPWENLPEIAEDEESFLAIKGKDSTFWSNQFNTGDDYAISYGWTKLERKDPMYQKFQAVNTIKMLDEDAFYGYAQSNFITAFQGDEVDITDYIKTGHLRFWVKVERDITVKLQLQDRSYRKSEIEVTFKATDENEGFSEVIIPLKDFYNSVEEGKVWDHSKAWAICIYPIEKNGEAFMKNGETMVFSPWQIWSKEPLNIEMDLSIYYYSQLGSDIKMRDNDQIMPSSTILRSFRQKSEEKKIAKLISSNYKGAKLLEYWAIYAVSSTNTGSYVEHPYDNVELMIPKKDNFNKKNLYAGLIGNDGSVKIIPISTEKEWLILKTTSLGNIAFFTSDKAIGDIQGSVSNDITDTTDTPLPQTGDKAYKVIRIWVLAFIASALALALIWFERIKSKKNITKALSMMLCLGITCTMLSGCGEKKQSTESKKDSTDNSSVSQQVDDNTSDNSDSSDDSESSDSLENNESNENTSTQEPDMSTPDTDSDDTLTDMDFDDETETEDETMMSIGVVTDHPGVPGYDADYEFRVSVGTQLDMMRLDKSLYTLSCSQKEIKIDGNIVTVPASFKDNTDVKGVLIKATYKEDPSVTAYYPLAITNYSITFEDNFDGDKLNRELWTNQEDVYHSYTDLKNGKTNIRLDEFCYMKDGNLVMPIVKNTQNKTWYIEGGNGKIPFKPDYISSEVRTDFTFAQEYGCFTVRMKGPAGSKVKAGTNNAFWLMPENGTWGKTYFFSHNSGQMAGLATGEIDVVERSAYWGNGNWRNTLHSWDPITGIKGNSGVGFEKSLYNEELMDGKYMEYTTVWTRDALYTYANGKLIRAEKDLTSYGVKAYMILSNNLNSMNPNDPAWTGYATDADLDDLTVYVDYVKVYSMN